MTARELRKLSRTELLEMLLNQVEENEHLLRELEDVRNQLASRAIIHEHSGSIAEAALQLSGVFDQAQQAADDYLASLRLANEEPEVYARKIRQEAQQEADAILSEARNRADRILRDADEYWQLMRSRVQTMMQGK